MDWFSEAVPVEALPQQVFEVIRDPYQVTQWSCFIQSVEDFGDGVLWAETLLGMLEFEWVVDPQQLQVTMKFEYLGYPAEIYFGVEIKEGQVWYREKFPLNTSAAPEQLEEAIRLGHTELTNVKNLAEAKRKSER